MTIKVAVAVPYFTGWGYQDQWYYHAEPSLPVTLDNSSQTHIDSRNKMNGQFTPEFNAIDYGFDATAGTWTKTFGGLGVSHTVGGPYEVLTLKHILDKYTSTLNLTVNYISDLDIHANNSTFTSNDVIIFGHVEYMTQAEYNNLKTWIGTSGGTAIFMDGNTMFAVVSYDSTATPIQNRLIDGHSLRWHPTSQILSNRALENGWDTDKWLQWWEHWSTDGENEDGSTPSDAGDKENYWNFKYYVDIGTGLSTDPSTDPPTDFEPIPTSSLIVYKCPWWKVSAHEEDYIVNPSDANVNTIFDYGGAHRTVATTPERVVKVWYQNKGHGRIIHMGNYTDVNIGTSYGNNRPMKAFYHWYMKKIAKPYFVNKPVTP